MRVYQNALEQAKAELANHDKRGDELRATIQGLEGLVARPRARKKPGRKPGRKPGPKPGPKPGRKPGRKPGPKPAAKKAPANGRRSRAQGAGHPEVKPRAYRGKGTTEAYRLFLKEHGAKWTVPQIRNALIAGGLKKNPSALLTSIHGIIRRDRLQAEKKAKGAAKGK